VQITEQDKRDIQETIKWLDEACFYLMQLKVDMEDGQWLKNVEKATDVAEIWLTRIIQEEK
tara:strand:+ start:446 stop:628 length:183 start_codon:yes stop_codon:yes gene_type:complete